MCCLTISTPTKSQACARRQWEFAHAGIFRRENTATGESGWLDGCFFFPKTKD